MQSRRIYEVFHAGKYKVVWQREIVTDGFEI